MKLCTSFAAKYNEMCIPINGGYLERIDEHLRVTFERNFSFSVRIKKAINKALRTCSFVIKQNRHYQILIS